MKDDDESSGEDGSQGDEDAGSSSGEADEDVLGVLVTEFKARNGREPTAEELKQWQSVLSEAAAGGLGAAAALCCSKPCMGAVAFGTSAEGFPWGEAAFGTSGAAALKMLSSSAGTPSGKESPAASECIVF